MAADPNIELMGQKLLLPTSAAGVVGLCGVLAGVVLVVYFSVNGIVEIMSRGNPKNVQEVAALFVSKQITNTGGQPEVREENTSKLIQFWSPSSDTKTDVGAVDQISADQSWQVTTEEHVNEFEDALWAHFHASGHGPLHGLRRYQEVGRGRTQRKRGWWWIMNTDQAFDAKELAKFYGVTLVLAVVGPAALATRNGGDRS
jgi:hypothetical protein